MSQRRTPRGTRTTRRARAPGCGCPCRRPARRCWPRPRGGAGGSPRRRRGRGPGGGARGLSRGTRGSRGSCSPGRARGSWRGTRRARPGPGHDEQVAPEAGVARPVVEPLVAGVVLPPVLVERGDHQREDGRQLVLLGDPDHVPVRDVNRRQVEEVRPEHLGVPAHRLVPALGQRPRGLLVAVIRVHGVPASTVAGMRGGDHAQAFLAPGEERRGDALAPGGRFHDGRDVVDPVAVGQVVPLGPRVADGGAVPLRDEAVDEGVGVDEMGVAMLHRREVDALEQAETFPEPRVRSGHAGEVLRPAVRAVGGRRSSVPPVLGVHVPVRCLADRLPAPALGLPEEPVTGARDVGGLPVQLAVAHESIMRQPAVVEGGLDRTPGLAIVAAVGEPATGREVRDVGEGRVQPLRRSRDAKAADPRGVDQERAARQADELPVRGRVAAARVVLADGPRAQVLASRGARSPAWTCRRRTSPGRRPSGRDRGGGRRGRRRRLPSGRRWRRPPCRARRSRRPSGDRPDPPRRPSC